MATRVVIQSRLSSKRLPAKALLPIQGIPSVVLCAKRAANKGADVVVATSNEEEDAPLIQNLISNNIKYVQGSLENVLDRFLEATADLQNNDIVIRLTADNLFPDGLLIEEAATHFVKNGFDFLTTTFIGSKAPYGLSIEIFRVKTLRIIARHPRSKEDNEHVTRLMLKHVYRKCFYIPLSCIEIDSDFHHLRCTIDTFEDYLQMQKIFSFLSSPIQASYKDLLLLLQNHSSYLRPLPNKIIQGTRHSSFTLGTAQLGLAYGKTNKIGLLDQKKAIEIIQQSLKIGISSFDTARAYGLAENRIGMALGRDKIGQNTVITKLDPLMWIDDHSSEESINAGVDASIFRSCYLLNLDTLPVVLLHRFEHLFKFGGKIWKQLLALKESRLVENLGCSVYSPKEAIIALQNPDIKYLQIPFNLIDWRWITDDFLSEVQKRPDVIIHARSSLLQGILACKQEDWPSLPNINSTKIIKKLELFVKEFGRINRTDLCYAYVRSFPWIASVVVGVETVSQLEENANLFHTPGLNEEEKLSLQSAFSEIPENLLNPMEWV